MLKMQRVVNVCDMFVKSFELSLAPKAEGRMGGQNVNICN